MLMTIIVFKCCKCCLLLNM